MHTQQIEITSALCPPNQDPIPLDTFARVAGVTTAGVCRTKEGPVIKTHLQWHPDDERFVCVTTLQDHLSDKHMSNMPGYIEDLAFSNYHKKRSYLSVTCKPYEDGRFGRDRPRVEFSNNHQYEAAPAKVFDTYCIKMANTLNSIQDTAFKKATDILQQLLLEPLAARGRIEPVLSYHYLTNEKNEKEKADYDDDQRKWPKKNNSESCRQPIALLSSPSKPYSLDDQDSTIYNLSEGQAPYESHSDVENKYGNHSNEYRHASAEKMRILTASYSCCKDRTQTVPKDMMTISHIHPETKKPLEYVGYFSKDGFTKVGKSDSIIFGGEDGAHFQHPGSQYNLHHLVKPRRNDSMKGILRLIMSTRRIRPFQDQLQRLSSNYELHRSECFEHTNIIEAIRGSCGLHEGAQNTATSVKVKNNPEQKLPEWNRINFASNYNLMKPVENIHRSSIVGSSTTVSTIDLIKSAPAVDYLSKEKNLSLQLNAQGVLVTVGQLVYNNGKLVRPGTKFDPVEMNNRISIIQSNNKKNIISTDRKYASIINLYRLTKNGSDLAECLDKVLTSYHNNNDDEILPLNSISVGGVGGAITTAGSTATKTVEGARNAPTTVLPHRQTMDDEVTKALLRAASVERCVYVFVGGVYLGLFHIKAVRVNKTPHKQAQMTANRLADLLKKLKKYTEITDMVSINEKTINEEMSWITTMGPTFTLVPVDPTFHHLWKKDKEEPEWNFHKLKDKEVDEFLQLPTIAVRKSDIGKVSGVLGNGTLTDVSSLVKKSPHLIFTAKGRNFLNSFKKKDDDEEEKMAKAKAQTEVQKREKLKQLEDLLHGFDETKTSASDYINLIGNSKKMNQIMKYIDSMAEKEDEEKEEEIEEKVRSSNS